MFLLVSVRHVGAHPDGHQHGVITKCDGFITNCDRYYDVR